MWGSTWTRSRSTRTSCLGMPVLEKWDNNEAEPGVTISRLNSIRSANLGICEIMPTKLSIFWWSSETVFFVFVPVILQSLPIEKSKIPASYLRADASFVIQAACIAADLAASTAAFCIAPCISWTVVASC